MFCSGKIGSPVHFSKGNEQQLIEVFKNIRKQDWVFSTHRSHYPALLKGVGRDWLREEILKNRSIHIHSREYKVFTSAIVGGALPIATGTALGIKHKNLDEHVWAFLGDMAAEMGIFHECQKYSSRHRLPITFVIEDNGISVDTPTQEVWGSLPPLENVIRYSYQRYYPHQGCGKWITF